MVNRVRNRQSTRRRYSSPLREQQVAETRERIVAACADLVVETGSLDIVMSAVAERAQVAEPTLYRHFPSKEVLFHALAARQFAFVTRAVELRSLADFRPALEKVFGESATIEPLLRWTLASPLPRREIPTRGARTQMLEDGLREVLEGCAEEDREQLLRVARLLTSPLAWLYWRDQFGASAKEAAATSAWVLEHLARGLAAGRR
jgi:AcrR family transcriptional regulator